MGNETDKRIKEDLEGVFGRLSRVPLEPSPYLSTRVMAQWREREARRGVPRFWRALALSTSALSLLLVVGLSWWWLRSNAFEAFVNHPFVVKMEVTDLRALKIAKAEIQLPEGVYFDLEDFPELKNQRKLRLAWHNENQKQFIPFVLNSTEPGVKRVSVYFYDEQDRLVGQKSLDIQLRKAGSHG